MPTIFIAQALKMINKLVHFHRFWSNVSRGSTILLTSRRAYSRSTSMQSRIQFQFRNWQTKGSFNLPCQLFGFSPFSFNSSPPLSLSSPPRKFLFKHFLPFVLVLAVRCTKLKTNSESRSLSRFHFRTFSQPEVFTSTFSPHPPVCRGV